MLLTKEFTFAAAHHLVDYEGKCARTHGHTYHLQITVEGPMDSSNMVMDFSKLSGLVKEHVIDELDHHDLNEKIDGNTTAENISRWIWQRLDPLVTKGGKVSLHRVRLWESPTSYVEYFGPE